MNRKRLCALFILVAFVLACQTTEVISEYLSPSATPTRARTATRPPPSVQAPTAPLVAVVTTPTPSEIDGSVSENAIIRAAPSTSAAIATRVNKGTQIKLVGRNAAGDWYQVVIPNNPNARGWISASLVQANGANQLPVVQPGGAPPYPRP
jgi:hypothetical protein